MITPYLTRHGGSTENNRRANTWKDTYLFCRESSDHIGAAASVPVSKVKEIVHLENHYSIV